MEKLPLIVNYIGREIALPPEWRSIKTMVAFQTFFMNRFTHRDMACEFWYKDKLLTEYSNLQSIFQSEPDEMIYCYPKYVCNEGHHDKYVYFFARGIDFKKQILDLHQLDALKKKLFEKVEMKKVPEDKLAFFSQYVDINEASSSYSLWFLIRTLFTIALEEPDLLKIKEIEENKHFLLKYKRNRIFVSCIKDLELEDAVLENFDAVLRSNKGGIIYGIIAYNNKWILTSVILGGPVIDTINFMISMPMEIIKEKGKFSDDSLKAMICTIQMLTHDNVLDKTLKYLQDNLSSERFKFLEKNYF